MAKQKQTKQTKKQTDFTPLNTNIIYYYPEDVERNVSDHYLNRDCCHSQDDFVSHECHNCCHVKKCIYEQKYKYRKIN